MRQVKRPQQATMRWREAPHPSPKGKVLCARMKQRAGAAIAVAGQRSYPRPALRSTIIARQGPCFYSASYDCPPKGDYPPAKRPREASAPAHELAYTPPAKRQEARAPYEPLSRTAAQRQVWPQPHKIKKPGHAAAERPREASAPAHERACTLRRSVGKRERRMSRCPRTAAHKQVGPQPHKTKNSAHAAAERPGEANAFTHERARTLRRSETPL